MNNGIARKMILCALLSLLSFTFACNNSEEGSSASGGGAASDAASNAGFKRYQIESGIVEYTLGGGQTGTETIYFDKWGMREARYTRSAITAMGISQKTNQLTLMDGEWIYNVDLDKKTGTRMKNPLLDMVADKVNTKDFGELGLQMLKDMGGEKIGSEEIIGKPCDIWESKNLGSKSWIWRSLTLKTEVEMAGIEMTSTATKMDEGVTVPEDKFIVPSDVTITETPGMDRMLEKMKKGTKK